MITLDELRESLTDQQREFLSRIWAYYQENKNWPLVRVVHLWGVKKAVRPILEHLGGSIIFEYDDGGKRLYELTLLGVLLTEQGKQLQTLIAGYLGYASHIWAVEPERTDISSHEAMAALNLDENQSMILGELIRLGNFWQGGSFGSLEWTARIREDIEDLPDDVLQYVAECALKYYDPKNPLSSEDRRIYTLARATQPTVSEFAFVAHPLLREQLESDWHEANIAFREKIWKACVVLCGGILEGMLLDVLRRDEAAALPAKNSQKSLARRDLEDLVNMAQELEIVSQEAVNLGHALRGFRNLVHPGRQLRGGLQVTEDEAQIAFNSVKRYMREIQNFITKHDRSSQS